MKGGDVVFAKEYCKPGKSKCVQKIQNVYGYKILTVTELYDESGKPLPILRYILTKKQIWIILLVLKLNDNAGIVKGVKTLAQLFCYISMF